MAATLSPAQQEAAEKKARAAAEKKAERKRKASLLVKQIAYDKIGREVHYGAETIKKHEKAWRQMLLDISLPKMRVELEYAWHNFERVIDAKDFTISLLLDELKEADEQYLRNAKAVIDDIDNLLVLCYDQIQELRMESKTMIYNLHRAATFERSEIINITKENEEYLKTMLYMLANTKKESEKLIRGEYLSKQEVEISRLQDNCAKFTDDLQRKYNAMWKDANKFVNKHLTECSNRKKEYTVLDIQDNEFTATIKSLWEQIRQLLDIIKVQKRKFEELEINENKKITDLTNERQHYESVFQLVKKRMEEATKLDEENLTFLTLKSNETIKYLQKLEKKGENLLSLSAICRKYESSEEKTMLFPYFVDTTFLRQCEIDGYHNDLVYFYNRIGQIESVRYKMNEELEYMKLKNANLRRKIHEYCQCLSCPAKMDAN